MGDESGTKTVHLGAGTTASVTWTGSSYRLRDGAKTWTAGAPITFAPTTSKLKLLTANDNGVVGHYRGRLRVVHLTDGLEIVNTLPLESYLLGVVPRESPASWPIEALKAQAVAARSYAYRATGGSGTFDVYCTTASQMYGGSDAEATASNTAVSATRGVVPKYKGTPIVAYFFSTSGGHTENIEDVWSSSAPVPYLKGVPDPYDYYSPYDKWPDNPIVRTPAVDRLGAGLHQGPATRHRDGQARHLAARRQGTADRRQWLGADRRRYAARSPRAARHVALPHLAVDHAPVATVTYGGTATINGHLYPAVGSGRKATLHGRPTGGSWTTSAVTATPDSAVIDVYTVKSSAPVGHDHAYGQRLVLLHGDYRDGRDGQSATSSSTCGPP